MNPIIEIIAKNGTYYYPAWKHYNDVKSDVTCDICEKKKLQACIGCGKYDACLECVDNFTKYNEPVNDYSGLIEKYLESYDYYNASIKKMIFDDVLKRLSSQKITLVYLNDWKIKRGTTEEFRIPEDISYQIIQKMFNDLVI